MIYVQILVLVLVGNNNNDNEPILMGQTLYPSASLGIYTKHSIISAT